MPSPNPRFQHDRLRAAMAGLRAQSAAGPGNRATGPTITTTHDETCLCGGDHPIASAFTPIEFPDGADTPEMRAEAARAAVAMMAAMLDNDPATCAQVFGESAEHVKAGVIGVLIYVYLGELITRYRGTINSKPIIRAFEAWAAEVRAGHTLGGDQIETADDLRRIEEMLQGTQVAVPELMLRAAEQAEADARLGRGRAIVAVSIEPEVIAYPVAYHLAWCAAGLLLVNTAAAEISPDLPAHMTSALAITAARARLDQIAGELAEAVHRTL